MGVVRAVDAENPTTASIRYQQIPRSKCISYMSYFYYAYISLQLHNPTLDDASDTLFSVGTNGATAGRIGLTGLVDRESTDFYTISIMVRM